MSQLEHGEQPASYSTSASLYQLRLFKLIVIAFLMSRMSTSSSSEHASSKARIEAVIPTIVNILEPFQASSASIGVMHNGKTLYTKGFGICDRDDSRIPDEKTMYHIVSCTKSLP
ncbi:uncharacterized protein LY89DRAFT_394738 [Mollisia scopiformis]|uniref:Beta-lactamase-related domain-containing protein n=1 Tax=Mollisia scopiformis TaxID=149040 RepID=A0A194XPP2_MOLSC|nr:uncharacterized protein LY89DRAFT_394738 [Mollisia scopiformis]KUJ22126.1 hypothetical protein LY89DRAFT_394738 [Mollisia scopiformis]